MMAHMIQWLGHSLSRILPCCDFLYMIEEVPLPGVGEGHLPSGGQGQLVGEVVGLLPEVCVLLSGAGGGSGSCS